MAFPKMTPIDSLLADLGMMVRRGRSGTLTPPEFKAIAFRIGEGLANPAIDPDGVLTARLERLVQATDDESLTKDQFEDITGSMRVSLCERRTSPLRVVPNFPVLPTGVQGRRFGRFMVVDGKASFPAEPTQKGA